MVHLFFQIAWVAWTLLFYAWKNVIKNIMFNITEKYVKLFVTISVNLLEFLRRCSCGKARCYFNS